MDTITWLVSAGGVLGAGASFIQDILGLDLMAFAFAILTPCLLLYGRHEVRLRRLRSIKDFVRSFGTQSERENLADGETPAPSDTARHDDNRLGTNPSFEFVKSKYISDVAVKPPPNGIKFDDMSEVDQIDWIIDSIGTFGSRSDWRIFLSTIGLMLLTYFGFSALDDTIVCGLSAARCASPAAADGAVIQLGIIGSLAFAGAYIAALRSFVRAVAIFDLTPYTFLRHTVEIVASIIFTIVLFVVLRDPVGTVVGMVSGGAAAALPADTAQIPVIWYGLAPLLGLFPQSATKFLLIKFQSLISWIKTTDDRFVEVSKITSLDIIDGIDYETRFRLEECGIYDVQNLATYNPIMLHIESPYGIYQVFDWIAQAQLCHILGAEKFLIFRELNIRTIFDLERAISSSQSVKAFDDICAGVLFASTSNLKETMRISTVQLIIHDGTTTKRVGADDFCLWARLQIQGPDFSLATEHILRWIADDLHVRRLRRLWLDISNSLGTESWFLPDNIDAMPPQP